MGLLSPGGVHSHQDHIAALVHILSRRGAAGVRARVSRRARHAAEKRARISGGCSQNAIGDLRGVRIATVSGRYYAMDRDKRWDRVAKAYDAIAMRKGDACARRDRRHRRVLRRRRRPMNSCCPRVIGDYAGMQDGDALLFANFRADRAREIFTGAARSRHSTASRATRVVKFSAAAGLTEYSEALERLHGRAVSAGGYPRNLRRICVRSSA